MRAPRGMVGGGGEGGNPSLGEIPGWMEELPGWDERLLGFKNDMLLVFDVEHGSQRYSEVICLWSYRSVARFPAVSSFSRGGGQKTSVLFRA